MKRQLSIALSLALLAVLAVPLAGAPASTPAPPKTTEFGSGPSIVLLHGMGSSRMSWLPTARKLLGSHHVVMMDLPGYGDTALPDPFSLQIAAEAIAQGMAAQKAESTIVVGQGLGGLLALMVASAHPERVSGVVLIDAAMRPEQPIPDQMQKYFLQSLDERYDEMMKGMFTRMGRDSAQGATLYTQAARTPPATMKAYLRELMNADGNQSLKGLKRPLLFIATEKRWALGKDWAAVGKQSGFDDPAAITARRIGNAGPLVATEQPDSLAALLDSFQKTTLAPLAKK
jgi:pimeloyl-ACP methyl ester carboxylesterase